MPEPSMPPMPLQPETSDDQVLPRVLGPFDAMTVVIGSIIGSGIFLKVDVVARELGAFGPIIAVWIIVGIVTLCGSLALAELAAMLPHAGGPYVYLRQAYGRLTAFLWGWTEFAIVRTGSLGSLACGTVIYLNRFLLSLEERGQLPEFLAEAVPLSHVSQGVITIAMVLILTSINVLGTRWAAWTQNITTVIKVAFLAIIIAGPILLMKANTANLQPLMPVDWSFNFWRAFGVAMVAVYWPYDGWINIGPVAEEIRDPKRNVPLGLALGMTVVIFVYVGANIGYHLTFPISHIQQSQTIAADVFGVLFGPIGVSLAALGVMVSTFGALNSNLLAGPRIYFAMARDGLFPRAIRRVHSRFQTPANAVVAQSTWAIIQIVIVFLVTDNPKNAFDTLTDFVILGGTVFYSLTVAAVYILRFKQPGLERPYKTWGYPITPALYLIASAAVVASTKPKQIAAVAGLLVVGYGVYEYFRRISPETTTPAPARLD